MDSSKKRHLLVVYHDDCIDGLASAWAMEQKWGGAKDVEISFIPYEHYDRVEGEKKIRGALAPETEVFFVDVAPEKAFLDGLMVAKIKSVTILDHHETAANALSGYQAPPGAPGLSITIDRNHPSAANLVWETLLSDQAKPAFVELVGKMDLARDLNTEDEYAAAAFVDSRNIASIKDAFNAFAGLSPMSFDDLALAGHPILSDQKNRIKKLGQSIMFTRIKLPDDQGVEKTLWVPTVNANVQIFGRYISEYLRQQGEAAGTGVAFAWFVQGNGSVSVSIRTDGDPDAAKVASTLSKQMGASGGGHPTSAAIHFSSFEEFAKHLTLFSRDEVELTDDKPPSSTTHRKARHGHGPGR